MKLNQSIAVILAAILLMVCIRTPVYSNSIYRDNPADAIPILKKNLIVIGSLDDYPIMYANIEGEASGLAVDLLNAFGEAKGYEISYELYPSAKVDTVFQGHGDIKYVSAPLNVGDRHAKELAFYYKDYNLFTRSSSLSLNNSFDKISAQLQSQRNEDALIGFKGQDNRKALLQQHLDILPYKSYASYKALLQDLNEEKIAYALIPDDLGEKLIKEMNYRQIQSVHSTIFTESSRFAISEKNNYLYYELYEYISDLKENGQRSQLIKKWFESHSRDSKQVSLLLIGFNICAALLIISILLMAYRNVVMQKIIDNKTAEIVEQTQMNEQLYSKLLRREQYKNSYFINLSHELRTPISVILNASQMINSSSQNISHLDEETATACKKASKYNGIINNNCYRLLRVITNIIDVNRLDSSEFSLRMQSVDLVDLLQKLSQLLLDQEIIGPEGITLDCMEKNVVINADPYELSRVFLNLISNSVKFCDAEARIHIGIKISNSHAAITYQDNSTGITDDMLPELFTRFYFESSVLVKPHEGSGLGLYLVRELLAMHKGQIEVVTKPKPFSYQITLPLSKGDLANAYDLDFKFGDLNQLIRMEFATLNRRKS